MRTFSSTQSAAGGSVSTHDLLPSERTFVVAMHQLGFGRFEGLRIGNGELVLDPWPTTIRGVKFGSEGIAVLVPMEIERRHDENGYCRG